MSNTDDRIRVHSDKLNLDFLVFVQNDTIATQQKCFILTVHDIGTDHSRFKELTETPEMIELKERIIWLHVNLPGQETNAKDLELLRYPSMQDLASELVLILDHFGIKQVTCLGEGAGANICMRFAILHRTRCLGLALVNPTCSTNSSINGFVETFKDKLNIRRGSKVVSGLSAADQEFLQLHKFGQNMNTAKALVFKQVLENYNHRNLSLFIAAFNDRSSIAENINDITVDVLTVYGKKASLASEAKKFYKILEHTRRKNLKALVNSPILEIENLSDVITDAPGKLTISLQYFLQGLGLMSALPIERGLKNSRKLSVTMQEADKPRRISIW